MTDPVDPVVLANQEPTLQAPVDLPRAHPGLEELPSRDQPLPPTCPLREKCGDLPWHTRAKEHTSGIRPPHCPGRSPDARGEAGALRRRGKRRRRRSKRRRRYRRRTTTTRPRAETSPVFTTTALCPRLSLILSAARPRRLVLSRCPAKRIVAPATGIGRRAAKVRTR